MVLNEGTTTIGAFAFRNCDSLRSVDFPASITSIAGRAFYSCDSLEQISYPVGWTSTPGCYYDYNTRYESPFTGCTNLTSVAIPYGVTTIPEYAFCKCEFMLSVEIANSVNKVGNYAFSGCTGLTSIDLPNSIAAIGNYAFSGCTGLTTVNMEINNSIRVVEHNGHYYAAFDRQALWIDAARICEGFGGYLATIIDAGEQFFVQRIVGKVGKTSWLGGSDYKEEGNWEWVTGEEWSYSNWASGEPNNSSNKQHSLCINTNGKWDDEYIDTTLPFVCEWDSFDRIECDNVFVVGADNAITVVEHNGHYYSAFDSKVLWNNAVELCSEMGGHLATVANANEQEFVRTLVNGFGDTSWLGGSDYEEEGTWIWITGEEWNYTNWDPGEPNNQGGNQDYLCIYTNGRWDDGSNGSVMPYICEWDSFDSIDCENVIVIEINDSCVNSLVTIGNYAFNGCSSLSDVFFEGTEEEWNTISIGTNNEPLLNATMHYQHVHSFGEYSVVLEPTCTQNGKKCRTCSECGYVQYALIDKAPHTYETTFVPPTYIEQGYTLYVCSVCGHSFETEYIDPLDRIEIANASITLEYTSAFYKGQALTPEVYLEYEGEVFDTETELRLTYANNDRVGTATVTAEGINRFVGSVVLSFEISYESIPEPIVNVVAIGETNKISISWGISSEVNTTTYRVYRKAEAETVFTLIATVVGRDTLSYSDTTVERDITYYYYVTGIGIYGEESEPSAIVSARVGLDAEPPVITKLWPASGTRINGQTRLTIEATDNVSVTRVKYELSHDGNEWTELGESTANSFAFSFDTSAYADGAVFVRAIAFDARNNASTPYVRSYSIDNTPPAKVIGLEASAIFSSKLTLVWNDVEDVDRASYVVQMLVGTEYQTLETVSTIGYNVISLRPMTEYSFRVACKDICGNQGEWSDVYSVTTNEDITPPTITKLSPEPYALNENITFSATAKDECGIAKIVIQISNDLETWNTISTNTYSELHTSRTHSCFVNMAQYDEGYVYLRAIAYDGSGNASPSDNSAAYNGYIIDRTAPNAPDGVSAEGYSGYITVAWIQGDENGLKYSVYRSTEETGAYSRIASNLTTINYHDRTVDTGVRYWYKVTVADSCGNISVQSEPVSAQTLLDTEKPIINSFSQTFNNCISDTYSTVSVLATDNSRLNSLTVEYKVNDSNTYIVLANITDINDYSKLLSVSIPVEELMHGDTVTLRAYAIDTAGLQSDFAAASYIVDKEGPEIDNFLISLENNICTLSWIGCGENDISGYQVFRSADGGDFKSLGARSVNSDSIYSFIDTLVIDETHTYSYRITAIDRLGNANSYEEEILYVYERTNATPTINISIPTYMEIGVEQYFDATACLDDGEITDYHWMFGDGTESHDSKAVKKYTSAGEYTVAITLTDDEGLSVTETRTVVVKDRSELGILNIKVVDDNYNVLRNAKVMIDRGEATECVLYTDGMGVATVNLPTGEHIVAAYVDSNHLPARKTVSVLANATRTVTLILVEQEIVVGEFEITRMTLDEIIAAGIDIYDPANQNVYQVVVRVYYGSRPLTISYMRNDEEVLSYEITDSNGLPVYTVTNSNGEGRILSPTIIPCGGQSDIVAILDIPAQTSYLKEFFDVKLYITNNASAEFELVNNEITLNVPDGMTLMTNLTGYEHDCVVTIETISGQNTVTLNWCLRGDIEGDYHLTADYVGNLGYFDEIITAVFSTNEPIKVYGLNGVEMSVLACSEIHNGAFYFKIGIENKRSIDIYMPNIDLFGEVENVTESIAHNNEDGDFAVQSYVLNIYLESESGERWYLPIVIDSNGKPSQQVDILAPGQKLVYEYVAYNAIKDDTVGYFKEAMAEVLSGYAENVVVGSYDRAEFNLEDFTAKLDRILDRNDNEIAGAYDYIMQDSNYYFVDAARDPINNALNTVYKLLNTVLEFNFDNLTMKERRDIAQQLILKILLDQDTIDAIEDQVALKYLRVTKDALNRVKDSFMDAHSISETDIDDMLNLTKGDIKELTKALATGGKEELEQELFEFYLDRVGGLVAETGAREFFYSLGLNEVVSYDCLVEGGDNAMKSLLRVLNNLSEGYDQSCIYATLYAEANYEYSTYVLDAIIDYCRQCTSNSEVYEHYLLQNELPDDSVNMDSPNLLATAVGVVAQMNKAAIQDDKMTRMQLGLLLTLETGNGILMDATKSLLKKYVAESMAAPFMIAQLLWAGIDMYFNLGEYVKQLDSMVVHDFMTSALSLKVREYALANERTEELDLYTLSMLKSICQMRLEGERVYRESVMMYVNRDFGHSITEEKAIQIINAEKGTSYNSVDEWYSELRYNILSSRDILFNKGVLTPVDVPPAPTVSFDYELNQTRQSFSAEYEYCLADGNWIKCNGNPISFMPKATQSVLRVRMAASDEHLAGRITTVFIYAQKELSKLISLKHEGNAYIFENLKAGRSYQLLFLSNLDERPDPWKEALVFAADETGTGRVESIWNTDEVMIRGCISHEDRETYSVPLLRSVLNREKLDIRIVGSGTVSQSRTDGSYFLGENIDLQAFPQNGNLFVGWYIDGSLYSIDLAYIFEMGSAEYIEARFTGSQPAAILVTSLPDKLEYSGNEELDLSGLVIAVQCEDGSTYTVENYSAALVQYDSQNGAIVISVGELQITIPVTFSQPQDHLFTIIYTINGSYFKETQYDSGSPITAPDYDIPEGYEFSGWNPPENMPAEDIIIDAALEIMKFKVAFIDGLTGDQIIERIVEYGRAAEAPDAFEHEGYAFIGWSGDFSRVTSDLTIVADYALACDVNNDGGVNASDAILIMRYSLGLIDLNQVQRILADVNGDGVVNASDAIIVMRKTLGLV